MSSLTNKPTLPSATPRASLPLDAILDGGHAPLSRFVGSCRVELHSLQRTELNGRCGEILPLPPPPNERVPVRLDGDVPGIMVRPQNILIMPPADKATDNDSGPGSNNLSSAPASSLLPPPITKGFSGDESTPSEGGWLDDEDSDEDPIEFVPQSPPSGQAKDMVRGLGARAGTF